MTRANFLWFLCGAAFGGLVLSSTVIVPQPAPIPHVIVEPSQSPEPPLARDDGNDLPESQRILFRRSVAAAEAAAEAKAEKVFAARGPGLFAKAFENVIDEATAQAEGRKTVTGIWSFLGGKLFQLIRIALKVLFLSVLTDIVVSHWAIVSFGVVAIVSIIFWTNGWIGRLFGVGK
jgi:hypothetical protein